MIFSEGIGKDDIAGDVSSLQWRWRKRQTHGQGRAPTIESHEPGKFSEVQGSSNRQVSQDKNYRNQNAVSSISKECCPASVFMVVLYKEQGWILLFRNCGECGATRSRQESRFHDHYIVFEIPKMLSISMFLKKQAPRKGVPAPTCCIRDKVLPSNK